MKAKKIEVLRAVEEITDLVTDLFAIEYGTNPDYAITKKTLMDFLEEQYREEEIDEEDIEYFDQQVKDICNRLPVSIGPYLIFLTDTTLYV